MRRNTALHDHVACHLRIRIRMIDREMKTAALTACGGALDDELRHSCDIAKLEEIASDKVLPVILRDLLLQEGDAPSCTAESFVRAHNPDIVPHQAPELVPVLSDDNG